MAAGRATIWLLLVAPGVAVIAIAAWGLVPQSRPTETHADAPLPPPPPAPRTGPSTAPAAPAPPPSSIAVSAAYTPDGIDVKCVAPPCDDAASDSRLCGWQDNLGLPVAAISGWLLDSDGRPVPYGTTLRFWTRGRSWRTWTEDRGSFVLNAPTRDADCDVDVVLRRGDFPDRRDGRFHVGRLRAGDRGVELRLPIARRAIASGTLFDAARTPLAGWRIVAHRGNAGSAATAAIAGGVTDGDGRFSIFAWAKSQVVLEIRTPSGVRRETASTEVVSGDLLLTAAAR
jgi:hypothetical protein